jgi:DNA-binding transcriptional LysR family regulator
VVLDQVDLARRDLADLRGVAAGRVRIGAFATAGAVLVPHAVAAFREAHPGVALSLDEGLSTRLLARVAADELDLAVVTGPPGGLTADAELHHLLDEAMLVALPRDHRLARRRRIRITDLAEDQWIAGSARPEATLLAPYAHGGFQPRIGFVASDWIAKQGLVAAGLGVTLVPALAAPALRPDLALVPLRGDDAPPRRVYAATAPGVTPSPATAAFLAGLRDTAQTLLRQFRARY